MKNKKLLNIFKNQSVFLALIIFAMILIISSINKRFLSTTNIFAILQQISVLGIATMAATMLLKSSLFDLSSSGIISLTCVMVAKFITDGMDTTLAAFIGLASSLAMGALNGIIISKTKTLPLIITLGMQYIYSGIALVLTGGVFIGLKGKFSYLGNGKILGIPVSVIVFFIVVVIVSIVLEWTRYGRRLVAIGNNPEAAYLSGIDVDKYTILNYMISGGVFGLAGLVLLSRLGSVISNVGAGYELRSIASAIVGGVSVSGGKGSVFGAFLGVILMGIISNGMNILSISSYYQDIVLGILIVVAVIISNIKNMKAN